MLERDAENGTSPGSRPISLKSIAPCVDFRSQSQIAGVRRTQNGILREAFASPGRPDLISPLAIPLDPQLGGF